MSFSSDIKDIKRLMGVLTGRDHEVTITYKGTSYGVTKPWHIRCDAREINDETEVAASAALVVILKKELADKIAFTQRQADEYKKELLAMGN